MEFSHYQVSKIRANALLVAASGCVGVLFGLFIRFFLMDDSSAHETTSIVILSALTGIGVSGAFVVLDPLLRKLQSKPLWITFLLTPLAYTSIIAVVYGVIYSAIMGYDELFTQSFLPETILFSLAIAACSIFLETLNRLLGKNVLAGLITGKYHRPTNERRFVMFLDLADSTSIAERIGNLRFHSFLNDFFRDMAKPVIDHRGDIYKYVGDEAIITWSERDGKKNAAAIAAFFALENALRQKSAMYEAKYGCVPRFRAGLHFGEVIVGEMGDYKKEIALLGDVMNTTARIQAQCRVAGVGFLVSRHAWETIGEIPGDYTASSRGECELRGKETTIELLAVSGKDSIR